VTGRDAELFELLANNGRDLVCCHGSDGEILFASDHAAELLGLEPGALLGKHLADLAHADDKDWLQRDFLDPALRGEPLSTPVYRLAAQDGVPRPVLSRFLPVQSQAGTVMLSVTTDFQDTAETKPEALSGSAQDEVSALKEGWDALALYKQAMDSSDAGITIADARAPDLPLIYVNAALQRMTAYREQEILGRNCRFLQGPDTDPETVAQIREHLDQGLPISTEILNYRRDGSPFLNELFISPVMDEAGEVTHFIGIQRDVEARRRMQEALSGARQDAQAAHQAKTEFLLALGHEIRNPLNAILGMADLLADTRISREQKDYVDVLKSAGTSLTGVVNDLLDLARIQSGERRLEQIPFSLEELIEDQVKRLAPQARAKGLDMVVDISPELPARLVGDPGRLRQILSKLLSNAIKFTQRGQVLLSVQVADWVESGREIVIRVEDTGIGIHPDRHATIFAPFKQAENGPPADAGGSGGLGLYIARYLAKLMKGSIALDSHPGQGSRFELTLNLARPTRFDGGEPLDPLFAEWRMVVATPLQEERRALRLALAAQGAEIETPEGPDALRAALAGTPAPDAVLADATWLSNGGRLPSFDGALFAIVTNETAERQLRARELNIPTLHRPVMRRALWRRLSNQLALSGNDELPESEVGSATSSGERSLRILLVEDDHNNRLLARTLLAKLSCQVDEAVNGEEALVQIKAHYHDYDLVLMDIQMPVMDGLAASRLIREWESQYGEGNALPIIALTANDTEQDRAQCFAAGCDDFMPKPFDRARLEEVIAAYSRDLES